jgi:hypothetical protein
LELPIFDQVLRLGHGVALHALGAIDRLSGFGVDHLLLQPITGASDDASQFDL